MENASEQRETGPERPVYWTGRRAAFWSVFFAAVGLVWFCCYAARFYLLSEGMPLGLQCYNNLRQIDGAKEQWASEKNKGSEDEPTREDLASYIKTGILPTCPMRDKFGKRGVYTIGKVGERPRCSVPGHGLPEAPPVPPPVPQSR